MATKAIPYERAVQVPGLAPERQAALVNHIARRNETLTDRPAVTRALARCAAVLMAADQQQQLSSPTALAQAELLAGLPAGQALYQLQAGLLALAALTPHELAITGAPRSALGLLLEHLQREAANLAGLLRTV